MNYDTCSCTEGDCSSSSSSVLSLQEEEEDRAHDVANKSVVFDDTTHVGKTIHINMNIEIHKRNTPPHSIPMMSGTNMNMSPLHQLYSSKSSSSFKTVIAEDSNKLSESEHSFNKWSYEALSFQSHSNYCTREEEVEMNYDTCSCTEGDASASSSVFWLQEKEEDRAHVADKAVLFNDTIQVREYAVTVGVSPAVNDSCPITLDWSFVEYSTSRTELAGARVERSSVRRLNLKQRRQRISQVQGWHLEKVRALEIERVLERMGEVMGQQDTLEKLQDEKCEVTIPHQQPQSQYHAYPFSERSSSLFASGKQWNLEQEEEEPSCLSPLSSISEQLESAVSEWALELPIQLCN
jgi:hypothetical protein